MNPFRFGLVCGLALACLPRDAVAITTSLGQEWNFAPDAWTRGNDADTSWFGWDAIEPSGVPLGFAEVLDDSTPDLGSVTTALDPRIYQGTDGANDPSPTTYGHRSGSSNYYSGFGENDFANDTITAIAPASGTGGFTTVVLQVIGQPDNPVEDLEFAMDASWTKEKDLYGVNSNGAGLYWQEWTAPGDNLALAIQMTSASSSRGLDAFQVDTYWTADSSPRINAISAIPEPGSLLLSGLALIGSLLVLRKNRAA